MSDQGLLFIVCGPSGVGKTTLARGLLDAHAKLSLSISYTTRAPRGAEEDGVHYHFVEVETFEHMRDEGAFAEWAEVHGNFYGTSRQTIEQAWGEGKHLLFDIDYQGAAQLKEAYREQTVATLVVPPSMEELERRLRGRRTDSDGDIARRLRNAREELGQFELFDYILVNDHLQRASSALDTIYRASLHQTFLHRHRLRRMLE